MSTGNLRASALAMTLWSAGRYPAFRAVLLVIVGSALLIISAKIKVFQEPVPITLQTFAIMAIAAAYGSRLAVATVVAYLAEGILGLPVFANTPPAIAGPAYFLGPTGGFLVGFIPLAFVVGYAADRGWDRSIPKLFLAMIVADTIVFILGFAWLAGFATLSSGGTGLGVEKAFQFGVQPFIIPDLLKIALAAFLIPAAWRLARPPRPGALD